MWRSPVPQASPLRLAIASVPSKRAGHCIADDLAIQGQAAGVHLAIIALRHAERAQVPGLFALTDFSVVVHVGAVSGDDLGDGIDQAGGIAGAEAGFDAGGS